MKILIAGMYNAFVNELIKKFDKENDKLYVLTGEHYHGKKPHRVFEQYTFSYTSNSVLEILDSVDNKSEFICQAIIEKANNKNNSSSITNDELENKIKDVVIK